MTGVVLKAQARRELRLVLVAEALAVGGLAAWATVFVPHAQREVGLQGSTIAIALVLAGVLAAITMRAAAGIEDARRLPALLIGVLTLGAGVLSSTVGATTVGLLTSLAPVAVGVRPRRRASRRASAPRSWAPPPRPPPAACCSRSRSSPAVRSTARCSCSPASQRSLRPSRSCASKAPRHRRSCARSGSARRGSPDGPCLLLALAGVIHRTPLLEADKAGFEALHGLGATPEVVESLLVEPSLRNYVIIVLLASLLGARWWGRTTPGRTLLLVAGSGIVAYVAVRTCWALWERPRPEEVLAIEPVNGHSWAAYPSFPSGHVAVTTALALATATLIPKLRYVLWTYAVVIAFTRLAYGAHFPSDVILGFVLGYLAVRTTIAPLPAASAEVPGGAHKAPPRPARAASARG